MRRNIKNIRHESEVLKVFLIPINDVHALRIMAFNIQQAESIALRVASKAIGRILEDLGRCQAMEVKEFTHLA